MIRNYFKTAYRNLLRHKGYALINLIGLCVGMTCCIVLFLFVQYEAGFDRFHENGDRIYRVIKRSVNDGKVDTFVGTPAPLAPALLQEFPEVEQTVRLDNWGVEIFSQGRRFYETLFLADPALFDVFTLPLVQGDPDSVLADSRSLLISESMGHKYFPDSDPMGQVLSINGDYDYTITGVFQDIPLNSHLRFDFLGSFEPRHRRHQNAWGVSNYFTYIRLSDQASISSVEQKMDSFIDKYRGPESRRLYGLEFLFQPLTDIHLRSHWRGELAAGTKLGTLYIFSAVALFILLIACFNTINLATARYTNRAPEVGMRKVLGAGRRQLIQQFMGESFLITLTAFPLTLALVEIVLPLFNVLSGRNLHMNYGDNIALLIFLAGILSFTGFAAGFYPAIFISSFQPVKVLKGTFKSGLSVSFLRKTLVVSQFVVSLVFVICTLLILDQLGYMRSRELGFNRENVVLIPINEAEMLERYETVKQQLSAGPDIESVCATSYFPGHNTNRQNYWKEGVGENEYPMIRWLPVDHDFVATFQIDLLSGRDFSRNFAGDVKRSFILNETAAKELGWDNSTAPGQVFELGYRGEIIGVVKDFNFFSLHQEIEPLVLALTPEYLKYFAVRIRPENVPAAMRHLKSVWDQVAVRQPFEYYFFDDQYAALYHTEMQLGKIFTYVAVLSLLIAGLGLFGLASFAVERRTKEIGIRKVLGASESRLVWLLSRDFTGWVLLANLFAWPIAYIAINAWLQNFAFRRSPSIWAFIISGITVLGIALFTVCVRALRAASSDPVKILKYE